MVNRNKIILGSLVIGLGALICISGLVWSNLQENEHGERRETKESQLIDDNVEEEIDTEQPSKTMRLYSETVPFYGGIGFLEETENPNNLIPEDIIEKLQSALQKDEIIEYAASIQADYIPISNGDILQYVQADTSGTLETYFYDVMKEDAEWFLFFRDGDIMIREKTDKEGYEYVYYKFPCKGDGVYGIGLRAYGKTSDYFFIQWDDEDYLMVTRSETFGETIDGIGVYQMLGKSFLGAVLCLDKNSSEPRFLSYVSNGNFTYGPSLPDY